VGAERLPNAGILYTFIPAFPMIFFSGMIEKGLQDSPTGILECAR